MSILWQIVDLVEFIAIASVQVETSRFFAEFNEFLTHNHLLTWKRPELFLEFKAPVFDNNIYNWSLLESEILW